MYTPKKGGYKQERDKNILFEFNELRKKNSITEAEYLLGEKYKISQERIHQIRTEQKLRLKNEY